jgi:hypothetical protein
MKYLLHVDHPTNVALVHKDNCAFISNNGGGQPYKDGTWQAFDSREEAFAALERTGKKARRGCMKCDP